MSSSAGSTGGLVADISDEWLRSVNARLSRSIRGSHISDQRPRIFRVPPHLRENDENAYEPRTVSLGPYHRGKERLKATEERQWHYLSRQLERNRDRSLNDYLKEMKALEARARSCYSEKIEMSSNEFAEMILLDGSFVVQFLIMMSLNERDNQDPTAGTAWFSMSVYYDMILLENQLPFFLLQTLYESSTVSYASKPPFSSLVLYFLRRFCGMKPRTPETDDTREFHHILHLFHSCIVTTAAPTTHRRPQNPELNPPNRGCYGTASDVSDLMGESIPNTVKLHEAGISFRKNEQQSLSFVAFRNGVVEMPLLKIYNSTGSCFRNLIAFEQCNPELGRNISNYASFMECLVLRAEDVALLQKEGVLSNHLGSEEAAAQLLSQLGRNVVASAEDFHLTSFFVQVNQYYMSRWPRWRAKLARDYFGNPWSIISFMAAGFLLLLSVTGTTFTIIK